MCGRFTFLSGRNPLTTAHCHHIIYRSDGRDDSLNNLINVCPTCHEAEHVTRKISISGTAEQLTIERHE